MYKRTWAQSDVAVVVYKSQQSPSRCNWLHGVSIDVFRIASVRVLVFVC